MDFQDRPLQCIDCNNEFVFTAGEQEFYERKGFREIPKRCRPCREARKARRGNGDAPREASGHFGGDRDGNRAPRPPRGPGPGRDRDRDREMFEAVCAACGAPARVPFRPANGRPVYCRECYSSRQGQGSGYGGGY